ncbi:MAG: hypothetical protein HWD61_10530 [Parachlamydiaceae bacterium]|nr:MAG: hypothetical protein HWD61_10530 [Parachlamydiaceae bacterium]
MPAKNPENSSIEKQEEIKVEMSEKDRIFDQEDVTQTPMANELQQFLLEKHASPLIFAIVRNDKVAMQQLIHEKFHRSGR